MRDHLDSKMRELTFKLIHMAPEAPPFPEVPMATLTPEKLTTSPRPPRRPVAAWAAAAAFVVVLLVGIPLLFFRGDPEPVGPATTVTTLPDSVSTTMPVGQVPFDVTLYYLADYVEGANVPGPHLVPVRRQVTASSIGGAVDVSEQLRAAVMALIAGPSADDQALVAGISTAVPEGTELLGVLVDQTQSGEDPRVVVDFSGAFESGGGTFSMTARLAQIVYTATQFGFPSVEFTIDGQPVAVFSSEGIVLDGPQTRDDYRDVLPQIFVEQPLPGDTVTSPIEIVGVANTFEATMQYRIELANGTLLVDGFTTATCGSGCWGDFTILPDYALAEPTEGFVVLFTGSPEDGRPTNIVRIPVRLEPAEGSTEGLFVEAYGDIPGGGPLNGAVVVEPLLTISGWANTGRQFAVGGQVVPIADDGSFEFTVELVPGVNQIVLEDDVINNTYTVTYVPGGSVEFAYLSSVSGDSIAADYAQWLTGDEANQAAFEDGVIGSIDEGVPNDYYIRNENPQLRELPVAEGVRLVLVGTITGPIEPVVVPLDEWLGLFKEDGSPWNPEVEEPPAFPQPQAGYYGASMETTPYWLTLDADGAIVQITQQYRP